MPTCHGACCPNMQMMQHGTKTPDAPALSAPKRSSRRRASASFLPAPSSAPPASLCFRMRLRCPFAGRRMFCEGLTASHQYPSKSRTLIPGHGCFLSTCCGPPQNLRILYAPCAMPHGGQRQYADAAARRVERGFPMTGTARTRLPSRVCLLPCRRSPAARKLAMEQ